MSTNIEQLIREKRSFWRELGYGLGDIYERGAQTLISFYHQAHNCLNTLLAVRRTGEAETQEDQAKAEELKKLLIG